MLTKLRKVVMDKIRNNLRLHFCYEDQLLCVLKQLTRYCLTSVELFSPLYHLLRTVLTLANF